MLGLTQIRCTSSYCIIMIENKFKIFSAQIVQVLNDAIYTPNAFLHYARHLKDVGNIK